MPKIRAVAPRQPRQAVPACSEEPRPVDADAEHLDAIVPRQPRQAEYVSCEQPQDSICSPTSADKRQFRFAPSVGTWLQLRKGRLSCFPLEQPWQGKVGEASKHQRLEVQHTWSTSAPKPMDTWAPTSLENPFDKEAQLQYEEAAPQNSFKVNIPPEIDSPGLQYHRSKKFSDLVEGVIYAAHGSIVSGTIEVDAKSEMWLRLANGLYLPISLKNTMLLEPVAHSSLPSCSASLENPFCERARTGAAGNTRRRFQVRIPSWFNSRGFHYPRFASKTLKHKCASDSYVENGSTFSGVVEENGASDRWLRLDNGLYVPFALDGIEMLEPVPGSEPEEGDHRSQRCGDLKHNLTLTHNAVGGEEIPAGRSTEPCLQNFKLCAGDGDASFRVAAPSPHRGIECRRSKDLNDRFPVARYAENGTILHGTIELDTRSNRWLRVGDGFYVPISLGSTTLLEVYTPATTRANIQTALPVDVSPCLDEPPCSGNWLVNYICSGCNGDSAVPDDSLFSAAQVSLSEFN